MHSQLRPWLLTYLADTDAEAPSGRQLLPVLHRRAADYFTELARRHPKGEWSLEVAYHCFAVGDATPATDWQRQLLTAAYAGNLAAVTAHTEVALATEQQQPVRARLPAVTAAACAAWVAPLRGEWAEAERLAVDAAGLYRQVDQPAGQAWADRLAGQAAWASWRWAHATAHWQQALTTTRTIGTTADRLAVLVALAEATLSCGELTAAHTLLDQAHPCSPAPAQTRPSRCQRPASRSRHRRYRWPAPSPPTGGPAS